MRIEAAYTYYTTTFFKFTVRNLDFEPVMRWVESLSREHRVLLGRNSTLEINIMPQVVHDNNYPPPNFLIDGYIEEHWKACQPFGNIYTVRGDAHKKHFLIFCRLASWWTWCSKPSTRGMTWTYTFDEQPNLLHGTLLPIFLSDHVTALMNPCVRKAWRQGGNVRGLESAAVELLNALDRCYKEEHRKTDNDFLNEKQWDELVDHIKKAVQRW
jgi:hypothetical protein